MDADIDARNPRTKMRHLPAGLLSPRIRLGICAVARLSSCLAACELNPLCLRLAPLALGVVFFYSYTKRFTSFSHLVLGFSLGIAPAAAWIAVRGSLDPRILLADRRGHVLDRRVRRDLLLPGLRIRLRERGCGAFRARWVSPPRCGWRACCTC